MKKKIWVMSCSSESGDHYYNCEHWDHEPSKEEINRVRIKLDADDWSEDTERLEGPFDPGDNDFHVELDGKKYICFISDYVISALEV